MDKATLERIRAQLRIEALENLVVVLAKTLLDAADKIDVTIRPLVIERLSQSPEMPGLPKEIDPTMSDLLAGEFEDAVARLLARISPS